MAEAVVEALFVKKGDEAEYGDVQDEALAD